jgi:hypothetical protein
MPILNNERHERFCQAIAAGMSQTQAYIDAGFRCESGKGVAQSASRLRRKPHIGQRIAELRRIQDMSRVALQERIEREVSANAVELIRGVVVTQEWVREQLVEIVERSTQHQPVLDAFGHPIMIETRPGVVAAAYKYDPKAAISALRLLGKQVGMFSERNEQLPSDERDDSEEELNRRLQDKLAEIMAKQAIAKANPK